MDIYYLEDLSREAKSLTSKLRVLTEKEEEHTRIVCAAPVSEMMLKVIKKDKQAIQEQLDQITNQAKEARLQIAINEGFTLKIGGTK